MGVCSLTFRVAAALLGVAAALISPRALALETQFDAPPECASSADFMALVRDRLPAGVESMPDFRAEVRAVATHFDARIWLEGAPPRRLSGDGCVEVLDGLAIILALRAERLQAERTRAAAARPAIDAAGWLPSATAAEPTPLALPSVASSEPRDVVLEAAPSTRERLAFRFGAGAVVLPNIAPGTAFGAALLLAAERRGLGILRLGVDRSVTGEVPTPPGSIWARLTAVRVTGCAFGLDLGDLRILPCLQVAGGSFEAGGVRTEQISNVSKVQRPWASLGPGVRAELRLSRYLLLAGEGTAAVPLIAQDLELRLPDLKVHESPVVAPYFGLTAEFVLGGSKPARAGIAR